MVEKPPTLRKNYERIKKVLSLNVKRRRDMNKTFLRLVTLVSITSCSIMLSTHELRTPLSLNSKLNKNGGYMHYPLKPAVESLWSVDLWGGAYYRHASRGMDPKRCDWCCPENDCCVCDPCCNACPNMCGVYRRNELFRPTCGACDCCTNCFSSCNCCCDSQNLRIRYPGCFDVCGSNDICCCDEDLCSGRNIPLSELFFGKAEFKVEEAFFGGNLIGRASGAPGLSFAKLRPKFDYNERGVILGLHAERRVENSKLRFGFNIVLPIKAIEVEMDCCLEKPENDVVAYKLEALNAWDQCPPGGVPPYGEVGESFAYRLDYLTTLQMPNGVDPLVTYGNNSLTVAGIELTNNSLVPTKAPAAVAWKRTDKKPDLQDPVADYQQFAVYLQDIQIPAFLNNPVPASGNGAFIHNTKRRFANTEDYRLLQVNRENQSQIFLVPVYDVAPGENRTVQYLEDARKIKNIVDFVLNKMDRTGSGSALSFLGDKGICFCCNEHIFGVGDLDIQCYGGYDFTDTSFGEIVFGLKLPTGKKNTNPKRVFWQAPGNNGHFETRFGLAGGWRSEKWVGLTADISYAHVLESCEKKAASYVLSTIKNIGPCIKARVKWGYFLGHLDLTVFNPYNQNMGLAFGYEAYYKRRDKVCFCPCDANYLYKDLLGDRYALDSTILEKNTNILAHKLRGEVFHRWNFFELYAGASRVVGGWNCMREMEAHLGFSIYF